jgi:hypothetical protein
MKKVMNRGWMVILAFVMVIALGITTEAQTRVSLQVFYDELQPYGTWMDYGSHGYVWVPRVDRGFVPYATNGYWINTDYGNTWVSDYNWGWAPFHYGRWLFDDFYGWVWVPDTEWAPAWVAWRSGGGYYGWAPLMPGMGIHSSFYFDNNFPSHYWSFVPYRYITYRQVYNHCVPRPQVVNIINQTTIITHNHTDRSRHTYFTGPTRDEIEHRGGGRVTVHKINERDHPGRTEVSHSTADFYRPDIDNSRNSRSRSVPSTFVKRDREGNFEQIEPLRNETNDVYSYRRTRLERNEISTGQRSGEFERRDAVSSEQNTQRKEYLPAQRTTVFEGQERTRTYQRIPQEFPRTTRDRYEAPPLERAPANREIQRQSETQPRQWRQVENQNTTRQESSVQPSYQRNSSINSNRTRSSFSQPPQAEIRKRYSGGANEPPAQATQGHSGFRKRN